MTLKVHSCFKFCLHTKNTIILGAHRALPDVMAMERILTNPSMVSCLSRLHIRSPSQQLRQWVQQKRAHIRKTTLMKELGKCVTAAQAARLDSLGIGIQDLVQLRDCNSQEGFLTALREKGVRSRALREKLQKALVARRRGD